MPTERAVRVPERGLPRPARRALPSSGDRPPSSRQQAVLALQRSAGNRAVTSMLQVQRWSDQSRGSHGVKVRMLQRLLNRAGANPQLVDDGIFGPRTQAAVRQFQHLARIPVSGVVGDRTWQSLQVGGRGAPDSRVALAGKALMLWALGRLTTALAVGATRLAQAPDPASARRELRTMARAAGASYRAALGVMALDTAFSVRQRRGARFVQALVGLAEALPAQTTVADPRVAAPQLKLAAGHVALMTLSLDMQTPEQFVHSAPAVLSALSQLVWALSRRANLRVAPPPTAAPAPAGP